MNICSYNPGRNVNDYYQLCKTVNPHLQFQNEVDEEQFGKKYQAVQKTTASLLAGQADLYCLQEVVNEERPLVHALKEKGYCQSLPRD